jgi:hypothetical protein
MTTDRLSQQGRRAGTGRRLLAMGAGVLSCVGIWAIVVPVAGHDLVVKNPGHADIVIGLAAVIFVAVLASLAGWLLLALLERFTRRARPVWTGVAIVVLLLSFLPIVGADTTTATRVTLVLMHLSVAAALFAAAYSPTRRATAAPAARS